MSRRLNQLPLAFPEHPNWAPEDFILSASNQQAWQQLTQPLHTWPDRIMWLTGPEGSGKTHLLHCWQHQQTMPAHWLRSDELSAHSTSQLVQQHPLLILEDAPHFLKTLPDETRLFHLLNSVREQHAHLILTAHQPPAAYPTHLPDVRSRLHALPVLHLLPPDDTLLAQLLLKQLEDRQLRPDHKTLHYMLTHMQRSFLGVRQLARRVDQLTLALKQGITIPLVKAALALDTEEE